MKKKIILSIISIIILLSFVGCSSTETGFVGTIKNILALTDFTFEGSLTLNVKTLENNKNSTDGYNFMDANTLAQYKLIANDASVFYDGVISKIRSEERRVGKEC